MSKISIDIDSIKNSLEMIGYTISDVIERENNGKNWQFKFSNSGAIVTVYDTNTKKNTVVNGKCEEGEQQSLKEIVDGIKCNEIVIHPLNRNIVELINGRRELSYFDIKKEWYSADKDQDMLHDILCLCNNQEHHEAYLVIGVTNQFSIVGVAHHKASNDIYDFLRNKHFAGDHIPEVELFQMYYQYHQIDVLVCKSTKAVPFYITDTYRGVFANQIYTRLGDTNTPKTQSANYLEIENLWRYHFDNN